MPRWMRALLIAAAAIGAAALVLNVLPGSNEPGGKELTGRPEADGQERTREEVIDALSDREREQLFRELGQHV